MLKKILKSYDYSIIIVLVMLGIFGLMMIYSASMVSAVQGYGFESDYFFEKQKKFNSFCIAIYFYGIVPYKIIQSNKILVPMVLVIAHWSRWSFCFWTCIWECTKLV